MAMIMPEDRVAEARVTIEHQIAIESSRDLLAHALYEVVAGGIGFGPRDLPALADRDWLRAAIAGPIRDATDVALHILAWRLAQIIDDGPAGLIDRYDASHRLEAFGWE